MVCLEVSSKIVWGRSSTSPFLKSFAPGDLTVVSFTLGLPASTALGSAVTEIFPEDRDGFASAISIPSIIVVIIVVAVLGSVGYFALVGQPLLQLGLFLFQELFVLVDSVVPVAFPALVVLEF